MRGPPRSIRLQGASEVVGCGGQVRFGLLGDKPIEDNLAGP